MSEQRRARLRLEISREASRVFWEQGVVTLLGVLRRWPRHSSLEDHLDRAASVVRVLDEHIGTAALAGADSSEFEDVTALARRYAHAIRTATGGAVGDPVG